LSSIRNHLSQNEKILATCPLGKVTFYVTNLRFIRYSRAQDGFLSSQESLNDLSFHEVTSLSLDTAGGVKTAFLLGIFVIIIGAIVYGSYSSTFFFSSISYLLFITGILLMASGIFNRQSGWQFKGPGLLSRSNEARLWRLGNINDPGVRRFITVAREQLSGVRASPSTGSFAPSPPSSPPPSKGPSTPSPPPSTRPTTPPPPPQSRASNGDQNQWMSNLYYNKGKSDSQVFNESEIDEINDLIEKIENSDPEILNTFPKNLIEDENYRKGYVDGLKSILEKKTCIRT